MADATDLELVALQRRADQDLNIGAVSHGATADLTGNQLGLGAVSGNAG
jgi:hypothetical protein